MAEKQKKLQEFRAKTASTAQQKLKQQQLEAKKEVELKRAQEKERMVKAREFAREQREKATKKAQSKKLQQAEESSKVAEPNPHAYKNTHAVRPGQGIPTPSLNISKPIVEQDGEESEVSALNIITSD